VDLYEFSLDFYEKKLIFRQEKQKTVLTFVQKDDTMQSCVTS